MHLLSKRKPAEQGGSRIGIVLSGSPLFNGGAGSGESEIRRWLLENDWVESIVALPTDLFYNTGIGTYVWVLSNKKAPERAGKVQLIDARADPKLRDFENVPLKDIARTPTSSAKSCPMCPTPGWPRQNQGRLRNQLQPPLLPFYTAAPAGRDRRRPQDRRGRNRPPAQRGHP
jgi:hypothetical protein